MLITINGNSLDPEAHGPVLHGLGLHAVDASNSNYILIQTSNPLSTEEQSQLSNVGVNVHKYVSENTYLCGYKPTSLAVIRALPFVTWANVYMKQFKVASQFKSKPEVHATAIVPSQPEVSKSRTRHQVDVRFHDDVDSTSETLKSEIAAAARINKDTLEMDSHKVRLHVEERYMNDLAEIDAVDVIEEVHRLKLRNNKARIIMNADVLVHSTSYKGAGQVVAVADTGFDIGKTDDTHPAFTGRVVKLYGVGRQGMADDPDGHGTHVCGSVLGDGISNPMGGPIQGTAPEATLVMQSLLDLNNGLAVPQNYVDLFLPPYRDHNARVHTNSWGATFDGRQLEYGVAREIDKFVWDHPDMVICFAAGNDGNDADKNGNIDAGRIGAESSAKNCITVGASENDRPEIKTTYGPFGFPSKPFRDDPVANNAAGMAAFSSRGPTKTSSRIKPDIVAPGTSILSTLSRGVSIKPPNTDFGESSDRNYWFEGGTSMATPLVAGCAAVLRETLVKNGTLHPSAALIKALLINGAVDIAGQYTPSETGTSPNNVTGFGRVNLGNSVIIPGKTLNAGFGQKGPLSQSLEDTINIEVPSESPDPTTAAGAKPRLKVTLVYSDRPGDRIQNDLNLIVMASDGKERHGNMGTSAEFDRVNNVEQVNWANIPSGQTKIIIRAFHIPRAEFPQPYAYVWRVSWDS